MTPVAYPCRKHRMYVLEHGATQYITKWHPNWVKCNDCKTRISEGRAS